MPENGFLVGALVTDEMSTASVKVAELAFRQMGRESSRTTEKMVGAIGFEPMTATV